MSTLILVNIALLFLFGIAWMFIVRLTSKWYENRAKIKDDESSNELFEGIKIGGIYRLMTGDIEDPFCDDSYIYCKVMNKSKGFIQFAYCDKDGTVYGKYTTSSSIARFKRWEYINDGRQDIKQD